MKVQEGKKNNREKEKDTRSKNDKGTGKTYDTFSMHSLTVSNNTRLTKQDVHVFRLNLSL